MRQTLRKRRKGTQRKRKREKEEGYKRGVV